MAGFSTHDPFNDPDELDELFIDPATNVKFQRVMPNKKQTREQLYFERAVSAAYLAHSRGFPMEPETIQAQDPTLSLPVLHSLLLTPKFKDALEARGIPHSVPVGLTGEQLYALQVLIDPTLNLSFGGRLTKLGIPFHKFEGWLKQPLFSRAYTEMTEKITKEMVPNALTVLNKLASDGDLKAIKLMLEIEGRYAPNQQANIDFRALVVGIMEVMEENISDDEDFKRVAAGIAKRTGMVGLELPELETIVIPEAPRAVHPHPDNRAEEEQ